MNDSPASTAIGPLDIKRVMAALPHRYPMLLVDRVVSLDPDKGISAIKAVTINEPFFQGHFPGRPIMPGVLVIEAMAQIAGLLTMLSKLAKTDGTQLVLFAGIDEARFKRQVVPGDTLQLHAKLDRAVRGVGRFDCRATVCKFVGRASIDGKLAAEANFTAMIADPPA